MMSRHHNDNCILKRLVMAEHAHTWKHNRAPLRKSGSIVTIQSQFQFDPRSNALIEACGYLGGSLQLVHGRVVRSLARRTLGGADELPESLRHVLHRVYEDHLDRGTQGTHGGWGW